MEVLAAHLIRNVRALGFAALLVTTLIGATLAAAILGAASQAFAAGNSPDRSVPAPTAEGATQTSPQAAPQTTAPTKMPNPNPPNPQAYSTRSIQSADPNAPTMDGTAAGLASHSPTATAPR